MSAKHENRNIDVNSLKEGQMGNGKTYFPVGSDCYCRVRSCGSP